MIHARPQSASDVRVSRVTITMPQGVAEALKSLAQRSGLRSSEVAREALREYRPLADELERLAAADRELLG